VIAADPFGEIVANLGRAAGSHGPNGHARERGDGRSPPEPIVPIRFPDKAGRAPPERRFVVDQWLPAGCVTSLYGPGGVGKSLLAQQIGTAVAVGYPLFGCGIERGPVLGLMCEDEDDELWRRQVRVNAWCGCGMEDFGDLHLQGRAGLENTLALYPAAGAPAVGALHEAVRVAAAELRPALIILDPIAQLYGGNENDRFQVSHFVNLAGGLAREFACAVLLLGHPGKAEESEYSGSTAWNASVRSRLLLQRKAGEGDELTLSRVKSNYARPDAISLRWAEGTLRPVAPKLMTYGDRLEAQMRAGAAEQAFLDALDLLASRGVALSHSSRAGNYAPRELERHGLLAGFSKREMEQAMLALLVRGILAAGTPVGMRGNRHPRRGLARSVQPEPAQGGA
jgi:hypothetical protein